MDVVASGSRRSRRRTTAATTGATTGGRRGLGGTALMAEFRAHEEDCAARVLQRAARTWLARAFVTRLLLRVYRREYDPVAKRYFYVHTETNEASWERPPVLALFLPADREVPTRSVALTPTEAARRIQRLARVALARQRIRALVRENFMKLFNPETRRFYYLDTRTGRVSDARPAFLRGDADDLPVETFAFRRAVIKIQQQQQQRQSGRAPGHVTGSGVLGWFRDRLCLLTDDHTLPSAEAASTAHALCNHAPGGVPFPVTLTPEAFFATVRGPELGLGDSGFSCCAVDAESFARLAGGHVAPLRLERNDRKLGCVDAQSRSLRVGEAIEVVGHPHGKPRVLHLREVAALRPHGVAPVRLAFDRPTETGTQGAAVFTRGGKLLGLQHHVPAKAPPPTECTYIGPILGALEGLVTPPEPFVLVTAIAPRELHVYWQVVRWYQPPRGLALAFELELCRHPDKRVKYHEPFTRVYGGPRRAAFVDGLVPDAMYSLRCRSRNALAASPWGPALRILTPPTTSLAWRVRYCTGIGDLLRRLRRLGPGDPSVHRACLEWLLHQLQDQGEPERQQEQQQQQLQEQEQQQQQRRLDLEAELVRDDGLSALLAAMTWHVEDPGHPARLLLTLRILVALVRLRGRTLQFLSTVARLETLVRILRAHATGPGPPLTTSVKSKPAMSGDADDNNTGNVDATTSGSTGNDGHAEDPPERVEIDPTMATDESSSEQQEEGPHVDVVLASLALLGFIVERNPTAQQAFEVTDVLPTVLGLLTRADWGDHRPVVMEACFLLGRYTHEHSLEGKWLLVTSGALEILRETMIRFESDPIVLYWCLVTLGNVAYGWDDARHRAQLEAATEALGLIEVICRVKMLYLLRVHELELAIVATGKELARLQAQLLGEDMRNALDACELELATLRNGLGDLEAHHVGHAADFGLRYLLTPEQRRVQAAARRLMARVLQRKATMAWAKWVEATVFARHRAIFRDFLTNVRHRQLAAGFRRWEAVVREWRQHKTVLQAIGAGLAIDLNRKKHERYRMLVLQK